MRIDQSRSWSDGVSPRGARAAAAAASVSVCECVCVAPPQEHAGTCSLSLSEGAEPPVCDVTCSRTSPQPEHWTVLLLYCSIYTLLKYNYKSYSVLKTFKAFYFHVHISPETLYCITIIRYMFYMLYTLYRFYMLYKFYTLYVIYVLYVIHVLHVKYVICVLNVIYVLYVI